MIANRIWTRIKREHGLYRYNPSDQYFARVRFHSKLYRRKLDANDLALAKRKLRAFKNDLERADATKGNTSFAAALENYVKTLGGSDETRRKKRIVLETLKQTWFGIDSLPLRTVKPSQIKTWLSAHYGQKSTSYYNSALTVIREALELAVQDKIIAESPAAELKYPIRPKPIRLTPTFEQFGRSSLIFACAEIQPQGRAERGLYRVSWTSWTRTGGSCFDQAPRCRSGCGAHHHLSPQNRYRLCNPDLSADAPTHRETLPGQGAYRAALFDYGSA
jgi:hypothetical protein